MTYTTIPSGWVDIGDPVKKELFDLIKADLDDLDTRTQLVEAASADRDVFNKDVILSSAFTTLTNLWVQEINTATTLSECVIQIYAKGSLTGTLEIDFLKSSTLDGTYTSVFTTKPSYNIGAGSSYGKSSNAVFNSSYQDIAAGNYLKLSITSMPTGAILGRFRINLKGEAT
jgi:hypothetical protein